jgi:hypothetical protein
MAEEALDDEEQDAEDCPKCPPARCAGLDGNICRHGDTTYGVFRSNSVICRVQRSKV